MPRFLAVLSLCFPLLPPPPWEKPFSEGFHKSYVCHRGKGRRCNHDQTNLLREPPSTGVVHQETRCRLILANSTNQIVQLIDHSVLRDDIFDIFFGDLLHPPDKVIGVPIHGLEGTVACQGIGANCNEVIGHIGACDGEVRFRLTSPFLSQVHAAEAYGRELWTV